jgi:hypothetical protein
LSDIFFDRANAVVLACPPDHPRLSMACKHHGYDLDSTQKMAAELGKARQSQRDIVQP